MSPTGKLEQSSNSGDVVPSLPMHSLHGLQSLKHTPNNRPYIWILTSLDLSINGHTPASIPAAALVEVFMADCKVAPLVGWKYMGLHVPIIGALVLGDVSLQDVSTPLDVTGSCGSQFSPRSAEWVSSNGVSSQPSQLLGPGP